MNEQQIVANLVSLAEQLILAGEVTLDTPVWRGLVRGDDGESWVVGLDRSKVDAWALQMEKSIEQNAIDDYVSEKMSEITSIVEEEEQVKADKQFEAWEKKHPGATDAAIDKALSKFDAAAQTRTYKRLQKAEETAKKEAKEYFGFMADALEEKIGDLRFDDDTKQRIIDFLSKHPNELYPPQ